MLGKLTKIRNKVSGERSLEERIVVPLDGSKLAEIALPYAEELAGRTGRDIVLLSVIEFADHEYRTYLQKVAGMAKQNTHKYSEVYGSDEVGVYLTTRDGNPAEAIVDFDLGALCPAIPLMYARLGWEFWCGPLFIRRADRLIPTPDEDVMILRLPRTPPLDLEAPLSVEWREGELW